MGCISRFLTILASGQGGWGRVLVSAEASRPRAMQGLLGYLLYLIEGRGHLGRSLSDSVATLSLDLHIDPWRRPSLIFVFR